MTLLAILSISLVLFSFSIKTTTLAQAHCLPDQRDALIQLKQGFNTTQLHSWNASTDCCIWDGITCDKQTGMVTTVDLYNRSISGEINPALFNLSSLQNLNLSENYFYNTTLPQIGFERLGNLTHLYLFDSGFVGQVPIGISALTKLQVLYLDGNDLYLHGTCLKTLLGNLTKLQVLDLSEVDISLNESEWGKAVLQIGTTLQELYMVDCGLRGNIPDEISHLTNLTDLLLSDSGFVGQVPIGISALTNLIELGLLSSGLYLHGTGLKTLLGNLTKLQVLDLSEVDISLNEYEWGKAVLPVGPTLQELYMVDCGLRGSIPDEISHLTNLTDLVLIDSGFVGQVPIGISALTNLIELELSSSGLYLHDTGLKTLLWNLTKLQVLHLNEVDISLNEYSEWGKAVLQRGTTLQELYMVDCGLRGNIPDEISHLTNLTSLGLSDNPMLSGQLPESIGNLQYLWALDLSNCSFYGDVPRSIINLTRLELLDLGSNYFNGTLNLDIIQHNQKLGYLDLSNNNLSIIEGKNHNSLFYASVPQISDILLASCNLKKFPSFLSYQKQIVSLDLSNNQIDGVIPNWLRSQTSITFLNLSHNFLTKIEGDADLTSLSGLTFLDIHSNRISGPVPLLPQGIVYVDFSSNHFFSLPPYFVSSYSYLSLSNNGLKGEIPLFICNQTSPPDSYGSSIPQVLDLSYNNLSGRMPPCLLEDAEFREVLNLRGNKLSGSLPLNISQGCNLRTINMSGNRINGSLPQSLVNCNTLEILDLGNNQIVDRFPIWLGNLENLRVLVLRSNQLYGTIPNREAKTKTNNNSFFPTIQVLDLSSNHFRGIIPKIVFQNLKAMVSNSNSTTFKFGDSRYYYQNSITVIWKGLEMEMEKTLSIFSSLDLSKNEFSGEIPEEIGQLKSLDVLNFSHNALTGSIPLEFANLQQLQSLDLSCNKLSGPIPQELTSLHFLSALNLSYNNLAGEIPQAPQLSTFPNASYLGNPRLCGSPLSIQCATTPSNDGSNKGLPSKSSSDIIELSVSIGLGLGVGFASIIWVLISWKNGREWFNFIVDRFYFQHIMWIVLHSRLAIGRE